jgi:DNA-directed RNA polymerase beta' subunit
MTLKDLERVLYFENYVVIEPGLTPLKKHQLLTEDEFSRRRTSTARTASPPDRRRSDPRTADARSTSRSSKVRAARAS